MNMAAAMKTKLGFSLKHWMPWAALSAWKKWASG